MTHAVFDYDYVKYSAASVGENKSIKAIHKTTGDEFDCKTRTDFWGHYKKKQGGILAEMNKQGRNWTWEDFEIVDKVEYEPIENILHTVNQMIEGCLYTLNTKSFHGYVGKGESFRVGLSTILEYKGNRKNQEKPKFLDDVTNHIIRKYKPEVITGIEADDKVVMDSFGRLDYCVVGVDKDYAGCPVNWFNPNYPQNGIVNCNRLGELFLNSKGEVKGYGRLFFYHQILSGDSSDNYKANSANPAFEWGDKSSYKLLKDCKTDKEALEALKKGYQLIYPEPMQIKGWRGDDLNIDWLYVAEENFQMARMLRKPDEKIYFKDVMEKFGLL